MATKLTPSAANPGQGPVLHAAFSNVEKSWEEKVDLVNALSEVLSSKQLLHRDNPYWIELENGLILLPQIVSYELTANGNVRTVTTIELFHPSISSSLFEYQHSIGNSLAHAIRDGFEAWHSSDLLVFTDLLSGDPRTCTFLEMQFPAGRSTKRRIALGPPTHVVEFPQVQDDEHPFCPCCLLKNNFDAFRHLIEEERFCALRLFVARDVDGKTSADCRVNGLDWPDGVPALLEYATGWPNRGFEYRKQLIVMRSESKST
jgi:hypothetical protein